ncbi:WecB/TagA/CpsF family glycosyltransferase [Microvirga sesbaniae]|uniref:WecB/TagA/CpsF family glycosyltransferase n=1 Tax=Microvirga sesbaniae TaxID=681392 RepID=UPI0021C5DCBC|nr:WecB/TagA/CpsF family glycosyltransferase [Microvirga sp. HBU67692]
MNEEVLFSEQGQSLEAPRAEQVRVNVFDVPVDAYASLESFISVVRRKVRAGETFLTTFVNPSSIKLARHDPSFARALTRFDAILPDGVGVSRAIEKLQKRDACRISFDSTSAALPVFELASDLDLGVALVGGGEGVAARAAAQLQRHFPKLRIVAAMSGYGDLEETRERLLRANPTIVVCGMGSIAQENFLISLAHQGWRGCGFTCGGYLDQLDGGLQYYPGWVNRLNIRFAYRVFREPQRLWRRYLVDYREFCLLYIKAALFGTPSPTTPLGAAGQQGTKQI